MEMKRIGQVGVEGNELLIVDPNYMARGRDSGAYASIPVRHPGTYPIYEFEHEGTIYAAVPIRPAAGNTWEGALGFIADRMKDAREQAGESPE